MKLKTRLQVYRARNGSTCPEEYRNLLSELIHQGEITEDEYRRLC